MKLRALIGSAIAAFAFVATPSLAQADHGAPGHGTAEHEMKAGEMKGHAVSDAEKAKMASCHALPHADAMKDAKCAELMKAHSDEMKHPEPAKHHM